MLVRERVVPAGRLTGRHLSLVPEKIPRCRSRQLGRRGDPLPFRSVAALSLKAARGPCSTVLFFEFVLCRSRKRERRRDPMPFRSGSGAALILDVQHGCVAVNLPIP